MRIQIIPDTTIDNKESDTMINNLHFYRSPIQRMSKTKDAVIIGDQYTLSYELELTKDNARFYLFFEEPIQDLIKTELNIAFPKSTLKESKENLKFENPLISELNTRFHYFMSLKIDRRGLTPLPAILETRKLFRDNDKVFIQVVFEPESNDLYRSIEVAIKEFQAGYVTKKIEINRKNIATVLIKAGIKTLQETLSIISFFLTDEEMKYEDIDNSEYEDILRRGLSQNTQNKSKWSGFNTQIRIVSDSQDKVRQESILRGIITAFKGLNEDNQIIENRITKTEKYLQLIQGRKLRWSLNKNILSAAELGQIFQLPTKAYQDRLESIDTREIELPAMLLQGNIKIGTYQYRGLKKAVYWADNKNIITLPKIIIGPMGAGKSEYTKRFCIEAKRKGDSLIVFDYIKGCELSEEIAKSIDCIKINLADQKNLFALAFPELQPKGSEWERLKVANTLSRQVEHLLNSLAPEPLTPKMCRYLDAACKVVFINENKRLSDVFNVLLNWQIRNEYIRLAKYSGCFRDADTELVDLDNLHDRDTKGKIIGTHESRIEGIIDRFSMLNKDIYLRTMLSAEIDYNMNLTQWIDEGKAILIQIPESTFTNKQIKDTLCTYFVSRLWLAALQRKNHAKVCHVVTDEVHQIPTAAKLISEVITEGRKFGIDFYFTLHYMKQFRTLHEAVKSAGASYMLLSGTEKENLKALEEELTPFTVEEGLNLKPFHSLNIINTGNKFTKFISQLPRPI